MGKIIKDELALMLQGGASQAQAAAHFQVSEAAISKAVSKIRQSAARPAILDKLTDKELRFSMEIAGGASQSHAASVAYNISTKDSAKSLGCTLMKNPEIVEAVTAIMASVGLGNRELMTRLRDHVSSADAQASLRAIDMGFKVNGTYAPTKAVNIHAEICPVDLSRYQ